jgi:wyosine [tRNA(Phe)-imidazoG37] synthetase (radical SAM superfamily)
MSSTVLDPICQPGLGPALSVNITPPACRVCNFDCTYCVVPREPREGPGVPWPSPDDVAGALASAMPAPEFDSVLIAGCGEPTLHPEFCATLLAVIGVVCRDRPEMPVRVRTNGSQLHRPEVHRALDLADERVLKLDPAPERTDRPAADAPLGVIVARAGKLRDFSAQSVFVEGEERNCDEASLAEWRELLRELQPQRVYLSTVEAADAGGRVLPLPRARLEVLAAEIEERLGIPAAPA